VERRRVIAVVVLVCRIEQRCRRLLESLDGDPWGCSFSLGREELNDVDGCFKLESLNFGDPWDCSFTSLGREELNDVDGCLRASTEIDGVAACSYVLAILSSRL
jgi:hypothetical protein